MQNCKDICQHWCHLLNGCQVTVRMRLQAADGSSTCYNITTWSSTVV